MSWEVALTFYAQPPFLFCTPSSNYLYNTIREIKEAIAHIVTTFYCPLTAQVHDDEYGDMNDVGDYEIRAAQYEIEEALEREQNPDFDMAAYITDHPTAKDKLVSAVSL